MQNMPFSSSQSNSLESLGYVPGFNVRTDLALEALEIITDAEEIPGVNVEREGSGYHYKQGFHNNRAGRSAWVNK